jgi:F-type H+-transporting ATPase subunit gamma
MELISTARFRKAMDRASAAAAYTKRITALVAHLAHAGKEVRHPLLDQRPEPKRAILLVLTANRGLCGGYNSAVLRQAVARYRQLKESSVEIELEVSGKRGASAAKYRGIAIAQAYSHFEDKPTFAEAELLANRYMDLFQSGQIDRLDVAYTQFESLSRQHAVAETLLPLAAPEGPNQNTAENGPREYDFLPSAESIVDELVPASFRTRLFKCLLDAAVSEQIARMVAMKAATENADTMVVTLGMAYNRARQTQITSELLEVISGAEALNH